MPVPVSQLTNTLSGDTYNHFYIPQCKARITKVSADDAGLNICFDNEEQDQHFSWFWIRDHSIDPNSLDQNTLQRLTDTFTTPEDISCQKVNVDYAAQLIELNWVTGEVSVISAYVFASVIGKAPTRHGLSPVKPRQLWDKNTQLESIPSIDFDAVMSADKGLQAWLENIHIYGFCVVNKVPSNKADTDLLAKRIGLVQETLFGKMWELSSEMVDHGDSAYSTSYLEPHTDGTYYHDAPGLQMFNCLQFDGKGGESVQVDGFAIAQQIRRNDSEAYHTLTKVPVIGHYIEPGVHVRAERPVFRLDSTGELVQVSFNNYDRAPFLLEGDELKQFHHAYKLFHTYANDQANWLKISLRPGLALIFDNWRNLHGRMGYVGKRVFYGCYHSKAEFESKLRILQANNSQFNQRRVKQ